MFTFAEKELMILSKTDPYSAILPFAQEILDLCKKVENSGQSEISIHFISELLANTIKKLLLKTPISPITGNEEEWEFIGEQNGQNLYKNNRCSGLFKLGNIAYYNEAIIWKISEELNFINGCAYLGTTLIDSKQYVEFPFVPKTFFVNVIKIPINKNSGETDHYLVIQDKQKLTEALNYYHKEI